MKEICHAQFCLYSTATDQNAFQYEIGLEVADISNHILVCYIEMLFVSEYRIN
jgi:hypothetical protein